MDHVHRRSTVVATVALVLALAVWPSGVAGQDAAPGDLRAALEGTWQLEEWHVDGQVLKPPQADGRWSNHDGVVLFMLHRVAGNDVDSTMGYGVYETDAHSWRYRYTRRVTSNGPMGGARVSVIEAPSDMRAFAVRREGRKVILENADGTDRREYEGPYFTLIQRGQIVRKWRRVE